MGERVRVGRVSELPDGEVSSFTVGNEQIAVARVGKQVFAVEDRCSHADCPLSEGLLEGSVVMCPCHAAGFDLSTGEPTNPPAEEPIRCFTVTIENGDFYIRL